MGEGERMRDREQLLQWRNNISFTPFKSAATTSRAGTLLGVAPAPQKLRERPLGHREREREREFPL